MGGPPLAAPSDAVTDAVEEACLTEIEALKPGNVHVYADGHDMTVEDFRRSARAAAGPIGRAGLTVGARILLAVEATRAATGCNTNLGIVLLCAPLAHAALAPAPDDDLRTRLRTTLADLSVADAEGAYEAIRLAAPAGLGRSDRHDVYAPATVTLRQAMAAAADRDRVARQYATAYEDVFTLGVPRILEMRERLSDGSAEAAPWGASSAYLGFLSRFADSHVARKYSRARAEELRRRAAALDEAFQNCPHPAEVKRRLLDFDAALKAEKINPGTSADLTVASLLAVRLADILARRTAGRRGGGVQ